MVQEGRPAKCSRWRRRLVLMCSLAAVLVILQSHQEPGGTLSLGFTQAMAQTYQGFGASTSGGSGKPEYRVKTLADSGAGSLRDAVSKGSRYVVFDVGGEIRLSEDIWVKGSFITIDGTTAPAPGITLKNRSLLIHGSAKAHDVIVRGILSRNSQGCDTCSSTGVGIGIGTGAYNVVLDRVSVAKAQDQAISINKGARDVTIQWSILAESKSPTGKNLPILVNVGTKRVSMHHNLFIKGYERLPQARYSESGTQASDTQLDMRNNIILDWGYAATQIWKGTRANIVGNYYYDQGATDGAKKRAIYLCHAKSKYPGCQTSDPKLYARAYVNGNVSGHGPAISDYLNSLGTETKAFPAAAVSTTDACTAAQQVRAKAGMHPLDSVDSTYIGLVALTSCVTSVSRSLE
jgi:pectate lyase